MLSGERSLTPQTQWKKVKGLFHHDSRYRAVETSAQREDWFNEFVKSLGRVRQCIYIATWRVFYLAKFICVDIL